MSTIPMYPSGNLFNLLAPDPAMVELSDIAHALGQLTRFGGRGRVPISVAQHSINVMEADDLATPALRRALLMHDAGEAYWGEVVCHIKRMPFMSRYRVHERRTCAVVRERFGIPWDKEIQQRVEAIDKAVGDREAKQLLDGGEPEWEPWPWDIARSSFWQEARWLGLTTADKPTWEPFGRWSMT